MNRFINLLKKEDSNQINYFINQRKKIRNCDLLKMRYIQYQEDRLPIKIQSKNLACGTTLINESCLQRIYLIKNLSYGLCFAHLLLNHSATVVHLIASFLFCLPSHWWFKYFIGGVNSSGKMGGIHQPFYGTWVVDLMLID